jgi:hypothetical protein
MRIFTKLLVTAILPAILLVCMLPQQAIPQSRANFWFLNNSGKTLNNLYVSPHSANSWARMCWGAQPCRTVWGR